MGDFIDFFLKNPFLIIVLIGILTSMLGKKKQPQQMMIQTGLRKRNGRRSCGSFKVKCHKGISSKGLPLLP